MPTTQYIPTKFPRQLVKEMDRAISQGLFISRSDIIRVATREKLKQCKKICSEKDMLVRQMKDRGDFESPEGNILSKIFLGKKKYSLKEFSVLEQKEIKKLLKHPMHILKLVKGKLSLTETGETIARGYLEGLMHAKTLF